MASLNGVELEEAQFVQDFPAETPPIEEVVSALRGAQEDVSLISALLSDEGAVVGMLLDALRVLEKPLSWVSLDPGVFAAEPGDVEKARVTSEGEIIVSHGEGEIVLIDLSDVENRDLLVKAVEDIIPKMKKVIEEPPEIEEPIVEAPEPVVQELPEPEEPAAEPEVPEIPLEEEEPAVEEPEAEAPLEEPLESEEPESEVIPEGPPEFEEAEEAVTEGPPEFEEPPPIEETSEPEMDQPDVWEPLHATTPVTEEPGVRVAPVAKVKMPKPPPRKANDNGLRRLRRRVEIQKDRSAREMARVQEMRDAQIRRLRGTKRAQWGPHEEEGVLSRMKNLLSRIIGKKR
ncbi:MAG: hypothetical protein NWF12_05505 [Candidatus Bathyarchaeota archaeon]|nr:hypothetical protein [Candidatus Bathyarchaeota archaeon]